jgi:glycine hydroxymethyltransferase
MSEVFDLIEQERKRQENEICLIASENYVSKDIMNVVGSILTNKYSEGYPNRRYYGGCKYVDMIEQYAIDKAKELFNCKWANVQPHSGSQANQSVYLALLTPGDTILGMNLDSGGHLTHGSKVSSSGKLYNAVSYGLDDDGFINYDEIEEKLYHYHPKLLIVGASAYPRIIDFERIRKIVDEYNEFIQDNDNLAQWEKEKKACGIIDKCYLMVDMAHIAGLVATGLHPSPLPYADVVTSTTHKTLRGPRGGIVLTNDETIAKKIDKAVFPGIQGGPLQHVIAGKAICFEEALEPSFKDYQEQVLKNIKAMEEVFNEREVNMISSGSDNHLILLDLRNKGVSGKQLEDALSEIGIVVNKNAIKDDPRPKTETSGIRIGTAAITTRGAKEKDCAFIAHQICHMIDILKGEYDYDGIELHKTIFEQQCERELTFKEVVIEIMKENTEHFCLEHPIYKGE